MKSHEVPLYGQDRITVLFDIKGAGEECSNYFDWEPLGKKVYDSRTEDHKYGDFYTWYQRLMMIEDYDRLEITILEDGEVIACAVLHEVRNVHYGDIVAEAFKATNGTREAARLLILAYRAAAKTVGFREYLGVTYKHGGYLHKVRRIYVGTV